MPLPVDDAIADEDGLHGAYAWVKDLLDLRGHVPFPDSASALAAFPNLTVVPPVAMEVRRRESS